MGRDAEHWLGARGLPARLVAPDGAVVVLGGWPADAPPEHCAPGGGPGA
jgi:thiamine biosynthesis lipoprotein